MSRREHCDHQPPVPSPVLSRPDPPAPPPFRCFDRLKPRHSHTLIPLAPQNILASLLHSDHIRCGILRCSNVSRKAA